MALAAALLLCGMAVASATAFHAPAPAASRAVGAGSGVKATLLALWAKTGLGPLLLTLWATLSVTPPFSWVIWYLGQIAGAPKLIRYYFFYSIGSSVAKMLVPGLYAQLVTSTYLSILKMAGLVFPTAQNWYLQEVATRLRDLLAKQAKLRGVQAPMSKEVLFALEEQLKGDPTLAEALGSVPTLGVWHRLEKARLDSPELLSRFPEKSQARWLIETLQSGYLGDVEKLGRGATLNSAAQQAARKMRELTEAVESAAVGVSHNAYDTGTQGSLEKVERASEEAAKAFHTLEEAAKRPTSEIAVDRADWETKLAKLEKEHEGVPAVAAELQRLRAAAAEVPPPPLAGRMR